jgi:hypothetical protein
MGGTWRFDKLDEHASGTLGVQEGNAGIAGTAPRPFIDEPEAFGTHLG